MGRAGGVVGTNCCVDGRLSFAPVRSTHIQPPTNEIQGSHKFLASRIMPHEEAGCPTRNLTLPTNYEHAVRCQATNLRGDC